MTVSPGDSADQTALRELVILYCRGCDRRDFRLVRSLYHDDAIDDHGGLFRGGPDALVEWLPRVMARWELTTHTISSSLFAIEGDQAEGEHHVRAYHRTGVSPRKEFIVHGRYLDRYARREGGWKFLFRSLVLDQGEIRILDEQAFARISDGAVMGTAGNDDPSWKLELLGRFGRPSSPSDPLE